MLKPDGNEYWLNEFIATNRDIIAKLYEINLVNGKIFYLLKTPGTHFRNTDILSKIGFDWVIKLHPDTPDIYKVLDKVGVNRYAEK